MNEKLHFEIVIKAPASKVWHVMLDPETYKEWTAPFGQNSYFEGSWEKGSKIRFLGESGDGGMTSEIAENIPHKFLSIKHLGIIKNGVDDTTSEEAKKWSPGFENYTFTDMGAETKLEIDLKMVDTSKSEAMVEMFGDMWPKALQKLKEICEK